MERENQYGFDWRSISGRAGCDRDGIILEKKSAKEFWDERIMAGPAYVPQMSSAVLCENARVPRHPHDKYGRCLVEGERLPGSRVMVDFIKPFASTQVPLDLRI